MYNILVLPRNHFLQGSYSGGVRYTLAQASALAEYGHNVHVVLPKKDDPTTKYDYEEERLPNWSARLMPIYATTVKDHYSGMEVYGPDLMRLLHVRYAKVPFDIVLNHNTAMAVGMHKPLVEAGYSCFHVPVLTVINNAASYAAYNKLPTGVRMWFKYWEPLECLACAFDGATIANPYDYSLMRKQIKQTLSPALAKKALSRLKFAWGPIRSIIEPFYHTKPQKKGVKYRVILNGAFGRGREEVGTQTEAAIEAMKYLYASRKNVELVVCTNSPEDPEVTKLLAGTEDFITVFRNPSKEKYQEEMRRAHIGLYARPHNCALTQSLIELLQAGKPIAYLGNSYTIPYIQNTGLIPYSFRSVNAKDMAAMIYTIMTNYTKAAENAYGESLFYSHRHSFDLWADEITSLMIMIIDEAEHDFKKRKFKSYDVVFKGAKDLLPESFNELYKAQGGKKNIFSLYSRTWVAKMYRRYGYYMKTEVGEDGAYINVTA